MTYKFDNEPCKICTTTANICVRVGDAIILDFLKWDKGEWRELDDSTITGIAYYYFCEACFEGVEKDIRKRRYFDEQRELRQD